MQEKKLESAGFKVSVDYDYSSTVDEGKVIKASPSGSVALGNNSYNYSKPWKAD